jgi:hypothetical protein
MRFAAVILTVGAHIAYLVYLPSGGFLALRWPRSMALHIPVVLWGVGVVALVSFCPSTDLQKRALPPAGMELLPSSGFIDRYVDGVFYPANRTGAAQALAFSAAAVSWVMFAWKRKHRERSR